ncbi:hypothetical protein [Rubidibacter lacunae]|nr:hypothetical protein [Rubidibacter lacunae]
MELATESDWLVHHNRIVPTGAAKCEVEVAIAATLGHHARSLST